MRGVDNTYEVLSMFNVHTSFPPKTFTPVFPPTVMDHLEDDPDNSTTFYSIGKAPEKKSENDATAFLIFSDPMITIEKQIATLVRAKKVTLLKLKNLLLQEGHTPLYFVEVKGHIENNNVAELFEELTEKFLIKHLGSYPE